MRSPTATTSDDSSVTLVCSAVVAAAKEVIGLATAGPDKAKTGTPAAYADASTGCTVIVWLSTIFATVNSWLVAGSPIAIATAVRRAWPPQIQLDLALSGDATPVLRLAI